MIEQEKPDKLAIAEHYLRRAVQLEDSAGDAQLELARFVRKHHKDVKKAIELYKKAADRLGDDTSFFHEFAEFLVEDCQGFRELDKDGYNTNLRSELAVSLLALKVCGQFS